MGRAVFLGGDEAAVRRAAPVLDAIAARFARLDGREATLVTGTDEHGEKVEESAAAKGVEPLEFATSVSNTFRELADSFDIKYDRFIRTTDDDHKRAVAALWRRLVERDQIYLGSYEGWYCVRDECFYNDSELVVDEATGTQMFAPRGAQSRDTAPPLRRRSASRGSARETGARRAPVAPRSSTPASTAFCMMCG